MKVIFICFFLFICSANVLALQDLVEVQKNFDVVRSDGAISNKEFRSDNVVQDRRGETVEGTHNITFTLSADAINSVIINNTETVNPGATSIFPHDFSASNGYLEFPIRSSTSSVIGRSEYDISLKLPEVIEYDFTLNFSPRLAGAAFETSTRIMLESGNKIYRFDLASLSDSTGEAYDKPITSVAGGESIIECHTAIGCTGQDNSKWVVGNIKNDTRSTFGSIDGYELGGIALSAEGESIPIMGEGDDFWGFSGMSVNGYWFSTNTGMRMDKISIKNGVYLAQTSHKDGSYFTDCEVNIFDTNNASNRKTIPFSLYCQGPSGSNKTVTPSVLELLGTKIVIVINSHVLIVDMNTGELNSYPITYRSNTMDNDFIYYIDTSFELCRFSVSGFTSECIDFDAISGDDNALAGISYIDWYNGKILAGTLTKGYIVNEELAFKDATITTVESTSSQTIAFIPFEDRAQDPSLIPTVLNYSLSNRSEGNVVVVNY